MKKMLIGISVVGALLLLSNVLFNKGSGGPPPVPGQTSGEQTVIRKTDKTPGPAPTPADLGELSLKQNPLLLLNPATVKPGSAIGVTGSGFDAGATVNFILKRKKEDQGQNVGFVQVDRGGNLSGFNFALPQDIASGPFILEARQDGAAKAAAATGNLVANSPEVKFGTQVGKVGDFITISAKGFTPGEKIEIHMNSLNSEAVGTVQADSGGGISQASLEVPFGAVGNNSFIFIGEKSQSPVSVPFLMLNLYPVLDISEYAAKADTTIVFSADGFGPRERVRIHLNDVNTTPVSIVEADDKGGFKGSGGFVIPYELKGKNTLIAIGEQSLAPTTVSFDVLPYTPNAEASTYGGKPGTTVTFYGAGFGRNEIVRVFVGRTEQDAGREVTCGKSNDQGNLLAGGSYTIPGNAQAGQLGFTLIGDKTKAPAKASMEVMEVSGAVPVPAEDTKSYVCSFDQEEKARQEEEQRKAEEEKKKAAEALTPQPAPTEQAQPGATPEAGTGSDSVGSTTVVVSNTEGEGVHLRQEAGGGDNLAVWPDGTRLELAGEKKEVDGEEWVKVKDPAGNEGWVPGKYLSPVGR
ncbi:MAG: hypothetical protein HYX94_03905 [Chloroflexi bacterium]|nr:hypothetical protein [Chloroflexota bacterium]